MKRSLNTIHIAQKLILITLLSYVGCSSRVQELKTQEAYSTHPVLGQKTVTTKVQSQVLLKSAPVQDPKIRREAHRHPTYKLRAKYLGEEKLGIRYFTNLQRTPHQVYACGKLLCDAQGRQLDPELGRPNHGSRNGKAIFVIDPQGRIWLTFDHKYGRIHHSSLVAGGPVLAAGEMLIDTGQLISISNESGHYHPPPASIDVALTILRLMGIDTSQTQRYAIAPKTPLPIP